MDTAAKKTVSAGGLIVNIVGDTRGKILVASQHGDSWSLPKGHIDPGEDALQTAYREIAEETGIQKADLTYRDALGSYERYRIGKNGEGEDLSSLREIRMFLFTTTATELRPTDPENPEARWVSAEEAVTMLTHTKDKEFLKSHLATIKNVLN